MADADEYTKAFFAALKLPKTEGELKSERLIGGRYGQARRKGEEETRRINENYLTPPAKRKAIEWQRRVLMLLPRIKRTHSLTRLVADIMFTASKENLSLPVDELAIRRFLNQLGYLDKPGRRRSITIESNR